MIQYKANTKFLFTGEYALLQGADALVLPLRFTQKMFVAQGSTDYLEWESWEKNRVWYKSNLKLPFNTKQKHQIDEYIIKLIQKIIKLKPEAENLFKGRKITIKADFDLQWGLGSSSTLISLLSQYANVDAYTLNLLISSGSGYDVVAATQDHSFLFTKRGNDYTAERVELSYPFQDNLFFVYTGRKQDTNESIKKFQQKQNRLLKSEIQYISALSKQLIEVKSLSEFQLLITEHEKVIAKITRQISPLKHYLPDFPEATKSLGAWGGDFILITWQDSQQELNNYLQKQGLNTYFAWEDIVLK